MTKKITSRALSASYRLALRRAQRYAKQQGEPIAVLQNRRDPREFLVASYDDAVNLSHARLLDICDTDTSTHEQDYATG